MHGTRPSTIGAVLASSPLALLSWMSEKFLAWTDSDPSLSTILESVTLYWFTQSFESSIFTYRTVRPLYSCILDSDRMGGLDSWITVLMICFDNAALPPTATTAETTESPCSVWVFEFS